MSRNLIALLVFSGVVSANTAYNAYAINTDNQLKALNTSECQAFSQVPRPAASFTLRRHTQEDTARFEQLRQACEQSVSTL